MVANFKRMAMPGDFDPLQVLWQFYFMRIKGMRLISMGFQGRNKRGRRESAVGTNRLRLRVLHDLLKRALNGQIGLNVDPIDAIVPIRTQGVAGHEAEELLRKYNVNVGRQDKFAASPPDTDILGDHLEEPKFLAILKAVMQFSGYSDDSSLAKT
ncbi:hypothetical protein MASR2M8_17770 [Opitutaceae bacterium]